MEINYPIFLLMITTYFYMSGHMTEMYNLWNEAIMFYNKAVYPGYWDDDEELKEDQNEEIPELIPPQKYEDKYLSTVRWLNKEWIFTDEENSRIPQMTDTQLEELNKDILSKIDELKNSIKSIQKEMNEDKDVLDCNENSDEDGNGIVDVSTLEERNEFRTKELDKLKEELDHLVFGIETEDGREQIRLKAEEFAKAQIVKERIDKLDNCYVMEKTPVGNVIMMYDKNREAFKFYSDASVPYRYLEVVGRKYVKMFNCRPLYIDMEEELRLFEEKWEKDQQKKKEDEEQQKRLQEENKKNNIPFVPKKNVFAKFKNYNKSAGGNISMAPPPKNNVSIKENKENEKIILKERANRYAYEGKFANFNFLQKIERKVFNKRLGYTFSDFKKLQSK